VALARAGKAALERYEQRADGLGHQLRATCWDAGVARAIPWACSL